MQKLLKELDWTLMAVIHDDSSYGKGGLDELKASVESSDICFPETIAIQSNNQTYIQDILKTKVFKIGSESKTDPPISGIVIFGTYTLSEAVLQAVEQLQLEYQSNVNVSIYPAFLFSETSIYIEGSFPNTSRGSFIPSPRRVEIASFQNYLTNLFLNKQQLYVEASTDLYLKQLYGHIYGCVAADSYVNDKCPNITRTELETRLQASVYNQFAIQAASAVAVAVKAIHAQACPQSQGVCNDFKTTALTKRNDFFQTLVGRTINFDIDLGTFRIAEFQNPDLKISFDNSTESILGSDYPLYEVYNHQICDAATNTACLKNVRVIYSCILSFVLLAFVVNDHLNKRQLTYHINSHVTKSVYICNLNILLKSLYGSVRVILFNIAAVNYKPCIRTGPLLPYLKHIKNLFHVWHLCINTVS